MKAVRILARLGADPEVKRDGRSAVFRLAVTRHVRERRQERIAEAYRRGYAEGTAVEHEFDGWLEEGVWLEP